MTQRGITGSTAGNPAAGASGPGGPSPGRVVLDPSRVAAQIVTGVGFLGAGLIFVRRDPPPALSATAVSALRVRYPDGRGILRQILQQATAQGFAIDDVSTEAAGYRRAAGDDRPAARRAMVEVTLHVHGKQSVSELAAALSELDEVDAVLARDVNATDE